MLALAYAFRMTASWPSALGSEIPVVLPFLRKNYHHPY